MRDLLKQAYPWQYGKPLFATLLAIGIALYTTLVTLYVKPFGLDELVIKGKYTEACIVFGLTTFVIIMYFMFINPKFFKGFYQSWKVYKEILLLSICTLCITLLNPLILEFFYRSSEEFRTDWVIKMVLQTNIGGLIPLAFTVVLNHLRLLKVRNAKYESQLIEISNKTIEYKLSQDTVQIETNEPEDYLLDLQNVLLVMAQGNYLEVYTMVNNTIKKELIRCTMTSFEDQVIQFPIFFRCHRTFMINIEAIKNIEGDVKNGFSVFYNQLSFSIPVSKNKSITFQQIIENKNLLSA